MARPQKIWWHSSREVWCVNLNGKQIRLSTDKAEAQKLFNKLMVAKDEKKPVQTHALLVAEVADKFLAWCYKHREKRTAEGYQEHWERFLKWLPNGKTVTAAELKPYHVIEYMDAHEWGNSYKRQAGGAVQRAFKWAVSVGLLNSHPCVTIPKPNGARRENHVPRNELDILLTACDRQEYRDFLLLSYETGARPQEIKKLEAGHYNAPLKAFLLPVSESKGKKRMRVIHINDKAMEIVSRLMEKHPQGALLRNTRGKPWTAFSVNCLMRRLAKKTGLKFCSYDLRHGRATELLEAGVDHLTVSAVLGHVDASTLARVYSPGTLCPFVDNFRPATELIYHPLWYATDFKRILRSVNLIPNLL